MTDDRDGWDAVGPQLALDAVLEARFDLEEALRGVEESLREGEAPTAAELSAVRRQQHILQKLVEKMLAIVADVRYRGNAGSTSSWTSGHCGTPSPKNTSRGCASAARPNEGDNEH